jgi:hypothetical protein
MTAKAKMVALLHHAAQSGPLDNVALERMAERALKLTEPVDVAKLRLGLVTLYEQRLVDAERRLHAERDAVLSAIEGEQPDPSGVWSEAISAAYQLGHQYREAVEHAADLVLEVDALRFDLTDTEALADARLREALSMVPKPHHQRGCRGCDYGLGELGGGGQGLLHEPDCRYVALRKLAGMDTDDD